MSRKFALEFDKMLEAMLTGSSDDVITLRRALRHAFGTHHQKNTSRPLGRTDDAQKVFAFGRDTALNWRTADGARDRNDNRAAIGKEAFGGRHPSADNAAREGRERNRNIRSAIA